MAYDPIYITLKELDTELTPWAKENLEFTESGLRAIQKAEIFIKTELISAGLYPKPPTWFKQEDWDATLKLIATKLSIYELYADKELEDKAADKREDAHAMLRALIKGGTSTDDQAGEKENPPPFGALAKGSTDFRGFKES